MSLPLDWEKIFGSVKRKENESLNNWFLRLEEKHGLGYGSLRAGWQRWGSKLYPEYFGGVKQGQFLKRDERINNPIKPDLTPFEHFSSPDWELPDGREEVKPQYNIEGNRMLAMMDIHLPFHDKQALMAAINEGKKRNVDVVLLNGDTADCVSLSKFNKSVHDRSFKDELDLERGFLKWLRGQFPQAQIIFKEGNHEKRFQDYVRSKADALDGIEEIELKSLLRLETWGITHIEHTQIMKFGKLNIIHGHEYFGGGTVNIARAYLLKAFDNIILGHRHQIQEYIHKKINQELVGAWAIGCLCNLAPAYMSLNQWGHGFTIIDKSSDGNFHMESKKIMNGQIL